MNRDQLAAKCPGLTGTFLEPFFDAALIGVVERPGELLPCYGYLHCAKLAAELNDPQDSWALLTEALLPTIGPSPVILLPVDRSHFWSQVAMKHLVVWEKLLHPAIIGVAHRAAERPAVVYHLPKTLTIVQGSIEESEEKEYERQFLNAVAFYEDKLASVDFGPLTPYFLKPLLELRDETL